MAGVGTNFLTTGKLETEIQRGANNEIDILDNIHGIKENLYKRPSRHWRRI
jgi:hypothetical protein